VTLLVGVGIALITTAAAGLATRDIGISLTSGGITGLLFIFAQSVMAQAGKRGRLMLRLASSQDLHRNRLRGRRLSRIALIGKNLAVADFSGADLRDSRLVGSDLTWSSLRGANLTGSVLTHAKLDETDHRGTRLKNIDLRNVNFQNARLSGAHFDIADLSGATLSSAILSGVRLGRTCYDDQTNWLTGFEPPPPDEAVRHIHKGRPDWRALWANHGVTRS
jgi:uncharacterized protein YjbI with pentapeptide repeats